MGKGYSRKNISKGRGAEISIVLASLTASTSQYGWKSMRERKVKPDIRVQVNEHCSDLDFYSEKRVEGDIRYGPVEQWNDQTLF